MQLSRTPLARDAVDRKLEALRDWTVHEGKLHKRFAFADFAAAFAWMTQVALRAEKLDHHPDWTNVYRTVDVSLHTHDAGGLTEYDFALAEFMDACAASMPSRG